MLLIDEIDKSDLDLPNDLLHVFEKGEFEIPELSRLSLLGEKPTIRPLDSDAEIEVPRGRVRCEEFPLVFATSNGERDFARIHARRCIFMEDATPARLDIVRAHFAELAAADQARIEGLVNSSTVPRRSGSSTDPAPQPGPR